MFNKPIKIILLIFFFLGGALFLKFFSINEKKVVEKKAPVLTDEETELFSKMWETLYFDANFGYALLGSKPVNIQEWNKDPLSLCPKGLGFFLDGRTKELWERFSKSHPSEHYVLLFKEYTSKISELEQELYGEVILINKAQVKRCYEQNKDLFTKYFSFPDFSAETIVTQILESRNHELIGIILGFGPYNSRDFQRSYDLRAYYKKEHYFPGQLFLNKEDLSFLKRSVDEPLINRIHLLPQEVALELQERTITDYEFLDTFAQNPLSPISLPCFRTVKKHPETIALMETYQAEQKKIVQFGFSKPLLDSILHIYFNGVPHE